MQSPPEHDGAGAEQSAVAPAPAAPPTRPARSNFPLPRELRDEIYLLLLDADHVHGPSHAFREVIDLRDDIDEGRRHFSVAHTYEFHASILGVNKIIRQEAGETLFKQNKFVVVSFKWPHLLDKIHSLDIPIVSQNQEAISRFEMDCAQLNVEFPSEVPGLEWKSVLMLLQDLDKFCRMIRWMCHQQACPVPIYIKKPGTIGIMEHAGLPAGFRVRTSIHFRSNPFFTFTPECFVFPNVPAQGTMADIMSALSQMTVGGQKFSSTCEPEVLTGPARKRWENEVQEHIGGPEVWLSRLIVVIIESIYSMRRTPDNLVAEGKYEAAIRRYCNILEGFKRMQVFLGPHLADLACPSVTPLLKALFQVVLDVAATTGFLLCRQTEVATWRYDSVGRIIYQSYIKLCALPDCREIHPYGSMHWFAQSEAARLQAVRTIIDDRSVQSLNESERCLRMLLQLTYGQHPSAGYIEYDLHLIGFIKDNHKVREAYLSGVMNKHALTAGLSCKAKPPQTISSSIPPAVVALMPTRFRGLQDLDRGVPGSYQG